MTAQSNLFESADAPRQVRHNDHGLRANFFHRPLEAGRTSPLLHVETGSGKTAINASGVAEAEPITAEKTSQQEFAALSELVAECQVRHICLDVECVF